MSARLAALHFQTLPLLPLLRRKADGAAVRTRPPCLSRREYDISSRKQAGSGSGLLGGHDEAIFFLCFLNAAH